jgi:hypothetical protein
MAEEAQGDTTAAPTPPSPESRSVPDESHHIDPHGSGDKKGDAIQGINDETETKRPVRDPAGLSVVPEDDRAHQQLQEPSSTSLVETGLVDGSPEVIPTSHGTKAGTVPGRKEEIPLTARDEVEHPRSDDPGGESLPDEPADHKASPDVNELDGDNPWLQISFDTMLDMPRGQVIDKIPPAEHTNYYLRGASLGSLALNLAHGVNRINIRNDLEMYVADSTRDPEGHDLVRIHAEALAQDGLPQHFNSAERELLSEITARQVEHTPAIILGVRRDRVELQKSSFGAPIIRQQVSFADIDPYSQAELSRIFGVDVANLPLTPEAKGPEFPPPGLPTLGGG